MTTRILYLIALALLAISITINIINGFTTSSTILTVRSWCSRWCFRLGMKFGVWLGG